MNHFHKKVLCLIALLFLFSLTAVQAQTPHTISDFEIASLNEDGWADIGWWPGLNSVTRIADPTGRSEGVLELNFASANGSPSIHKTSMDAEGAYNFSALVYLPSDFPDSAFVRWWGQDNNVWSHFEDLKYYGVDLPKETWVPINFHLRSRYLQDSTTFNVYSYQFGWCGFQFYSPDTLWSGVVYVDDFNRLGADPVEISDFDIQALGVQGWQDPLWGTATSLAWAADPTGVSTGVLEVGLAGDNSVIEKSTIPPTEREFEIVSYKIWLPADIPDSLQLRTTIQENSHWNDQYTVAQYAVDLPKEQWVLVEYELKHFFCLDSTLYHPYPPNSIGRIHIFMSGVSYTGTVYFDEFRFMSSNKAGAPGVLQSPPVIAAAAVDTVIDMTTSIPLYHHLIEWEDLPVSMGESYNLYVSETGPITNVSDPGVVQISTEIPRGTNEWNEAIYSLDGGPATRYYALTATGIVGGQIVETPVRIDTSNTGAVTSQNSIQYQEIPLVSSFNFTVDGDISEFTDLAQTFTRSKLYVQEANGDAVDYLGSWDPNDLDFEGYVVMDANNLYIGFEVIDDDPTGDSQPWEGDGLDVFGALMDVTGLTSRFMGTGAPTNGAGCYRMSYAPNAATYDEQLQKNGGGAWTTTTGVDHGTDVWEDGYVVEIKVPFATAMAEFGGSLFTPVSGMYYLNKIDVNDNDDTTDVAYDGDLRTLQGHWGGIPGNFSGWLRAEGWTPMIITDTPLAPNAIDEEEALIPLTTKLYENFPNPFNPRTTVKYDLQKTADVKLEIYNLLGQKVKTLVNKKQAKGKYQIYWHGLDDFGNQVATGNYFLKFETDNYSKVQKMLLIK